MEKFVYMFYLLFLKITFSLADPFCCTVWLGHIGLELLGIGLMFFKQIPAEEVKYIAFRRLL